MRGKGEGGVWDVLVVVDGRCRWVQCRSYLGLCISLFCFVSILVVAFLMCITIVIIP